MYDIKPLDLSPKGIEICAELLSLVYSRSDQASEEKYLNWEYNLNPIGKAVGYNAWSNNQLAAHYVTQPIIMLINGKEARGLLSINTATHPEHQRKKLFTTLADATYQRAKNLGYSFVIGVANANSTHGFVRKLEFELISPLTAKIGIGRINYQSTRNLNTCERLWSRESLEWRLRDPLKKYSIRKLNNKYIIETSTGKLGIRARLGIFDKSLLPDAKYLNQNIFTPFKLYLGIDNSIDWTKSRYYNIPERFRPSPLNLIFKKLNEDVELDRTNIKFQMIDFDAY